MELFNLVGRIAIDNTKANAAIDDTATKARHSSDETSEAFAKIGTVAGNVAKGIGVVGAVMGGAFIAAVEGTREYRQEMGKLDTAFVTSGHSSETARNTYSALNAVLGDSGQAVEASNHLALLTDNEKDLSTWTDICTGVYATFGDSLPIESLTESANEVAKSGELTGGLVDALVWAGIGEEEFQTKLDSCTSEQERQNLIMNTLNGTYSKASDQYKKTNKDVMDANAANDRLTSAMAKLGAVGEPVMTAIKNAVASMTEKAIPVLEKMGKKIQDMTKWFKENETKVKTWAGVIGIAIATVSGFILVMSWSAIMTKAANAIKIVTVAIKALNVAMRANVVGLVVTAIMGLVAAFIYLWKNCDSFRNFWIGLWGKIKSASGKAVDWIKNKFNVLKSALSTVKNVFGSIKDTITGKLESAKNTVKSVIDKIKGFFNITLKFKGIKMPSIKLTMEKGSGLMAKAAELLGLSGVPKFSVKWNAEGGILDKPTIFGRLGDTLLGGGEAGEEAVAPIDVLQDYTRQAVAEGIGNTITLLIDEIREITALLRQMLGLNIYLDTGTLVGSLVPALNDELGNYFTLSGRNMI